MRHRRRTRKLGMKTAHREAMFRNMVTSLFEHGRITTTVQRAKELKRLADKMVTLAKRGDLHARRQALAVIRKKEVVAKLFEDIGARFADRSGGYTRVLRIGPRRGDAAMMALVELAYESLRPKGRPTVERRQPEETDVIPTAITKDEEEEAATSQGTEGQVEAEQSASAEPENLEEKEIEGEEKGPEDEAPQPGLEVEGEEVGEAAKVEEPEERGEETGPQSQAVQEAASEEGTKEGLTKEKEQDK